MWDYGSNGISNKNNQPMSDTFKCVTAFFIFFFSLAIALHTFLFKFCAKKIFHPATIRRINLFNTWYICHHHVHTLVTSTSGMSSPYKNILECLAETHLYLFFFLKNLAVVYTHCVRSYYMYVVLSEMLSSQLSAAFKILKMCCLLNFAIIYMKKNGITLTDISSGFFTSANWIFSNLFQTNFNSKVVQVMVTSLVLFRG